MSLEYLNDEAGSGAPQEMQQEQPSTSSLGDHGAPPSQVAEFYHGRCVLVTGASGFLGKLIIEKLLRTCRGVRKIFVLIRAKKLKSPRARLNAIFESPIFDTLKAGSSKQAGSEDSFEELIKKVVLLQGELTQPYLGLSIERLLQLADECSVILHAAAVVSFDAGQLRRSVATNLAGTHNVLQLATKLPRLRALVHVSTCYSNCPEKQVGEHIYPANIDPRALIEIIDSLDDESLATLGEQLKGKHPNYYTYTKQLAEYLCAQYASAPEHQLPIVVCRPSIIISTYEEPVRAFLDNRNAGNGMFDGVSRGLMRTIHGSESTIMDQVPADFVVNCTLALGWFADLYQRVRVREERTDRPVSAHDELVRIDDVRLETRMLEFYRERKRKLRLASIQLGLDTKLIQMPVFHVSSGIENPITFAEMFALVAKHSLEFPSIELFRKPGCRMVENKTLAKLDEFAHHTCVGHLLDWLCAEPRQHVGKRSSNWTREFERLNKFNSVLPYFYFNSFKFYPDNRLKLLEVFMNDRDRREFNCDIRQVNWDSFAREITLGIRKYLIGEAESGLPEARAKLSTTLWRNSLLQLMFISLISYFFLTFVLGY